MSNVQVVVTGKGLVIRFDNSPAQAVAAAAAAAASAASAAGSADAADGSAQAAAASEANASASEDAAAASAAAAATSEGNASDSKDAAAASAAAAATSEGNASDSKDAAAASAAAAATSEGNASDSKDAAAVSASAAHDSEESAAASAAQAIAYSTAFTATSVTNLTIGLGAKALTVQVAKSFQAGEFIQIASAADASNWMWGTVTSYDLATGALEINATRTGGAGTFGSWNISMSGPPGVGADAVTLNGKPDSDFAQVHAVNAIDGTFDFTGGGQALVGTRPAGDASSQAASTAFASALQGFRNRIINGDMRIDQRNAGAAINNVAGHNFPCDRWDQLGTLPAKVSGQRVTPAGIGAATGGQLFAYKATSLSAYAPLAADVFQISQKIEGVNVADLMWGTANAKAITVSFWAYASEAGDYAVSLSSGGANRSFVTTYALAANTWTYVALTITGDTAGVWATNNTLGIELRFNLGSGSNFQAPAANAWQANNYTTVVGCVNLCAINGATFYLTGVQLERGSVASVFEQRQPALEKWLCQRYFETSFPDGVAPQSSIATQAMIGIAWSNTSLNTYVAFKVPKRSGSSSITFYNPLVATVVAIFWGWFNGGGWINTGAQSASNLDINGFNYNSTGSFIQFNSYMVAGNWTADNEL